VNFLFLFSLFFFVFTFCIIFIRDGFGAKDFHQNCDNKGATLTIIHSHPRNHVFGGYSPLSWDSQSGYKTHPNTFLFTLTNPHNIPPTKYAYNLATRSKTIYCHAKYGPTFGDGLFGNNDICVSNESNQNKNSYTSFPCSFVDTTGSGKNTFTGAEYFTINEIEVYLVDEA
jgi:TLD